ncbi:E4 [Bovine papillomavirus type 8-EB]|uniref:E4 n=2 Tax=Bos taurus papillomavirus 8 TaxID=2758968 RepID=A6XAA3_9PAPI|nr:E4 [Bos taurus papillomavirus 8]ABD60076.1 E4 [Bovine papillomavirus type 8-EB]QYI89653.1 E4 early protein [Bos taurus papillomavirus 8]QYI89661.1 E4 early protein [Bos taurus papillomavirus 8]
MSLTKTDGFIFHHHPLAIVSTGSQTDQNHAEETGRPPHPSQPSLTLLLVACPETLEEEVAAAQGAVGEPACIPTLFLEAGGYWSLPVHHPHCKAVFRRVLNDTRKAALARHHRTRPRKTGGRHP